MAVAQKKPSAAPLKDLYEIGEVPPLGHVPAKMYAWAIRKERHGPPEKAMQHEVVPTWPIAEDEVLVYVMAGGVNYNGVWAGLGVAGLAARRPQASVSHRRLRRRPASSGRSAPRCKRWKVGDEVIVHCNQDDGDDEECNGGDPLLSPSQRIWGYETPDGSFAQFCRVQSRQLMPKPPHLTWEEAACYTLTLATAYRMLFGHAPHILKPGDNVLVWGASGGLGVFGVQLVAASGANAIGIVSDRIEVANTCSISAPRASSTASEFKCWGADAEGRHARIRRLGQGGAPLRQGDLGHHRQARRRHRVRASRRGDVSGVVPGRQARRHGGVLRRHHRLQHHLRRALCVDAAEAGAGLALRASQAGERRQPVRHRPPRRSVHERRVPLGQNPATRTN